MSEKEKVMNIILKRSDLCDIPTYDGTFLTLPAELSEVQDALHRARITNDQPYQIVDCINMKGEELNYIPKSPSLAELNFLAHRICDLSEQDRIAFAGCAMKGNGNLTVQDLIQITYTLEKVHVIQAANDFELGRFYLENNFVNIPPDYQSQVIEPLDLEKIGRIKREEDGGTYVNGMYLVENFRKPGQVYDDIHLPEQPPSENYVFELMISYGGFYPSDLDECTMLKLPATPDEIAEALESQGIESLRDCVILTNKSSIPHLNGVFSEYEDIEKIMQLAEAIHELRLQGQEAKYKAVLDLMDCTDIDLALDLTRNLNCFDFYPELSSAAEYIKQEFFKKYHIPWDDPVVKTIQFSFSIQSDIGLTPYGIIYRNENEMSLDYSNPQTGQQLL